MALETRKNRSYYYRKERRGRRVHSVYAGAGEIAHLLSSLDESRAEEERCKRTLKQMERERLEAEDAPIRNACSMIETLMSAALISTGFHAHKGQWRRKR